MLHLGAPMHWCINDADEVCLPLLVASTTLLRCEGTGHELRGWLYRPLPPRIKQDRVMQLGTDDDAYPFLVSGGGPLRREGVGRYPRIANAHITINKAERYGDGPYACRRKPCLGNCSWDSRSSTPSSSLISNWSRLGGIVGASSDWTPPTGPCHRCAGHPCRRWSMVLCVKMVEWTVESLCNPSAVCPPSESAIVRACS